MRLQFMKLAVGNITTNTIISAGNRNFSQKKTKLFNSYSGFFFKFFNFLFNFVALIIKKKQQQHQQTDMARQGKNYGV